MTRAICSELEDRVPSFSAAHGRPTTLYFGGGTPTVLGAERLTRIVALAGRLAGAAGGGAGPGPGAASDPTWEELTVEANPEDLSQEMLEGLRRAGVSRLSIGVQTFDDGGLEWMNRAHTGREATEAVERAAAAGFERISVDLIYGIPGRAAEGWADDVRRALELPVDHVSAYLLTVEPRTVLGRRVSRGEQEEAPEPAIESAYAALCEMMAEAGWNHYEVSNFAKPGSEAVHNARYWNGAPYLGIGPGAHSFDGAYLRTANPRSNPRYIKTPRPAPERDEINRTDRYNEVLMTGLRTARGIRPEELESAWGLRPDRLEPALWAAALAAGDFVPAGDSSEGDRFRIPEGSWLRGDDIASRFFSVD